MSRLVQISLVLLTFAVGLLGVGMPAHAQGSSGKAPGSAQHCVLIDTDIDIDDIRAIPAVIAKRHVVGIVATTGAGEARTAGSALAKLIAEPNDEAIPVIVGATDVYSPLNTVSWLQPIRAAMATANGYLVGPTLAPPYSKRSMLQQVKHVTRGCTRVEVLIIGPFTSFVRYSPEIRDQISRVVMQGKPYEGDATQPVGKYSFNCGYDLTSCKQAFRQVRKLHPVWVDVPRGEPMYEPTLASVNELRTTGLPGALHTALLATLWTWEPNSLIPGNTSYLWDDSAAVYLWSPKSFAIVGAHFEPKVSPEQLRTMWVDAVNSWSATS